MIPQRVDPYVALKYEYNKDRLRSTMQFNEFLTMSSLVYHSSGLSTHFHGLFVKMLHFLLSFLLLLLRASKPNVDVIFTTKGSLSSINDYYYIICGTWVGFLFLCLVRFLK